MPTNNGDITFKYGTQNAYNDLLSIDENAIYVTTDTHRIYIGGTDYTDDTQMNDATKQYVDASCASVESKIGDVVDEKIGDTAAATTEEWLTEHVNPVGSAVVVDNSLTISGAAADAQVTGSRVDNAITSVEHFPFAEIPSNVQTYALRNLKIISSAYSELYVHRIIRGGSGGGSNVVHAIILRNENGSDIKLLNVLTSEYTEVAPETPVYFENGGVKGYYNIDWSKVTYGTQAINSNNGGKGAKINSLAMPSHSVTDSTLTKQYVAADAKAVGDNFANAASNMADVSASIEHFPFAEIPSNVQTYALRNLKIISSAYSELYVHRIIRGGSGGGSNVVHAIILRNENGSDIKLLNVLTSEYTEVAPETPVYFEDNGVSGYYNIDWTKVTYGTMAVNSNNSNKGAKINSFAMPSHSVTDSTLTKQYVAADAKAVGDELKTMQKEITGDGFVIPDVIYGVVGYPFSIYYYNIFQIDSLDGYHVELQGASEKYKNYGDRVRLSCDEVASYTITINIRRNNNVDIASKTITVNILPNTQHTVKAIFIGDSFIWDGKMVAQIKTLMGNSMTLYGTVQKAALNSNDESVQISCEGRAGWSLYDYVNLSQKSGVTNAFWDGEKFNFSYYITQNPSYADVTDVFILSGPNDNGATPENYAIRYNQIIASIKAYSAAIKIHCFMPLTCNCDGYAWGARNYNGASKYRYNMISYAKKVMEIAADDSGVSAVPMHINFDRHYNFPLTQVAVNDRTPTLITVFGDNVHPNNYGYYCMADVIYADIIATAEV